MILFFIRLYQAIISPLFPPNTCRFYPTCSDYAIGTITKHGKFKGTWMAIKRILKCQPFHPGGYDPVP
ncbi:MAG: membrane protein insertion efficiency factor YidD [Ignavibacteriales bacterium]|nr:membrane protein insertion efficiency factor YidD [Ignavibacteriales bacterium]